MNRLYLSQIGCLLLLLCIEIISPERLLAQNYLAKYAPIEIYEPEKNAVSDLALVEVSAERYVAGTTISASLSRTAQTVWMTDAQSELGFTKAIYDPAGVWDLTGNSFSLGLDKELWLGGSLTDNGQEHGLITHLGSNGEILRAFYWQETPILSIDFDPGKDRVYAVGTGIDNQGDEDLRLVVFNGQGDVLGALHLESTQADGIAKAFSIPGNQGYTLIGWQSQGAEKVPVWLTFDPAEGQLESRSITADRPILNVTDASYLESEGIVAVTGTALADNGTDALAFLLTLDREGNALDIVYYRGAAGSQVQPTSVQAFDATSVGKGFVLAGSYRDSLNQATGYAWATRMSLDGTPQWNQLYVPAGAADVSLQSSWEALEYDAIQERFVASGPAYYIENGSVVRFEHRQLSARLSTGLPGGGTIYCVQSMEAHVQQGSLDVQEGGFLIEYNNLPEEIELETQDLYWATGYCAEPNNEREGQTSTNIEPVVANPSSPMTWVWYDLQGRQLLTESKLGHERVQVPSTLPKGIYVLRRFQDGRLVDIQRSLSAWP